MICANCALWKGGETFYIELIMYKVTTKFMHTGKVLWPLYIQCGNLAEQLLQPKVIFRVGFMKIHPQSLQEQPLSDSTCHIIQTTTHTV